MISPFTFYSSPYVYRYPFANSKRSMVNAWKMVNDEWESVASEGGIL